MTTIRRPASLLSCLTLSLLISSCASLEERLCNSTIAFQKGYSDVTNGKSDSPGLKEGESCKNSKNFSFESFHRDYMAGFEKAKVSHCTQSNALEMGRSDAASNNAFRASMPKLAVCLADEKIKVNLNSIYEIGYRKEFCQSSKMEALATMDSVNFGESRKKESDFDLCAYQKAGLYKTYQKIYTAEIRKQCTASRGAGLGITHARERKNMSIGLGVLEKCPSDLVNIATQAYTAAYQSERVTMMEEERLRIEKDRLARENDARNEMLRIRRQELELEQQRQRAALNSPPKL